MSRMVVDEVLKADMVLVNGKIVTVDPEDSKVEAVAIKDGRIVYQR